MSIEEAIEYYEKKYYSTRSFAEYQIRFIDDMLNTPNRIADEINDSLDSPTYPATPEILFALGSIIHDHVHLIKDRIVAEIGQGMDGEEQYQFQSDVCQLIEYISKLGTNLGLTGLSILEMMGGECFYECREVQNKVSHFFESANNLDVQSHEEFGAFVVSEINELYESVRGHIDDDVRLYDLFMERLVGSLKGASWEMLGSIDQYKTTLRQHLNQAILFGGSRAMVRNYLKDLDKSKEKERKIVYRWLEENSNKITNYQSAIDLLVSYIQDTKKRIEKRMSDPTTDIEKQSKDQVSADVIRDLVAKSRNTTSLEVYRERLDAMIFTYMLLEANKTYVVECLESISDLQNPSGPLLALMGDEV